jgi:hypothetical protein
MNLLLRLVKNSDATPVPADHRVLSASFAHHAQTLLYSKKGVASS